jgi:uncharacterized protein YkwD
MASARASVRDTIVLFLSCSLVAPACQRHAASAAGVADGVFDELNRWRRAQNVPELERAGNLDAAAERRANEAAARPSDERLGQRGDLSEFLQRAGVRSIARAAEYLQTQRGHDDPPAAAIARWRRDASARQVALDPDWDVAGVATTRADDGTLVLSAILAAKVDSQTDLVAMERRVEQLVNDARRAEGLRALAPMDVLAEIARAHSRDMAHHDYLGHEDRQGHGPDWRVRQRGVRYRTVAENVAENQGWRDPAKRAVDDWLGSRGHRRNIMDRALTHAGVGVALDSKSGKYYFTQLFLQPAPGS